MTSSTPISNTGVLGLALNQHRQYLITLRHDPDFPPAHNKWQVPGGGIEIGETPEQALARELKEELNIEFRILFPYPIAKTQTWNRASGTHHITLLCYLIDIGTQTPKLDHAENTKYRWIMPEEINQLHILPLTDDFVLSADHLVSKFNLVSQLA